MSKTQEPKKYRCNPMIASLHKRAAHDLDHSQAVRLGYEWHEALLNMMDAGLGESVSIRYATNCLEAWLNQEQEGPQVVQFRDESGQAIRQLVADEKTIGDIVDTVVQRSEDRKRLGMDKYMSNPEPTVTMTIDDNLTVHEKDWLEREQTTLQETDIPDARMSGPMNMW